MDSTNYLIEDSDIKGYFKSVSEHLKDDGLFIFDINTEYKIKEVLGNNLYSYDDDDVVYIWDNHFENNVVDMNLTFFVKKGQVYKRFDEFHRERAYSDVELRKYISEAGMKAVSYTHLDVYKRQLFKRAEEILIYEDAVVSPEAWRQKKTYVRNYVKDYSAPLFGTIDLKYTYTEGRK